MSPAGRVPGPVQACFAQEPDDGPAFGSEEMQKFAAAAAAIHGILIHLAPVAAAPGAAQRAARIVREGLSEYAAHLRRYSWETQPPLSSRPPAPAPLVEDHVRDHLLRSLAAIDSADEALSFLGAGDHTGEATSHPLLREARAIIENALERAVGE